MSKTILLTAAIEDVESVIPHFKDEDHWVLHLPLEVYTSRNDNLQISDELKRLDSFENIVYGSRRNASFFIEQLRERGKMDELQNGLNLAIDEPTFNFLERRDIAAVHPQHSSKAVDVLELMLRLQRLGHTLYPCGADEQEEFPALLQELDMPVTELPVFKRQGPSQEALSDYHERLNEKAPDAIIFHSRRSVSRTLAAFPNLSYDAMNLIAADAGITNKLQDNALSVDGQAEGNWKSVIELVKVM